MNTNFEFSSAGWMRDLSPRAREEIERRFPALPVAAISSAAGYYRIRRDEKQNPTPAEAQKVLRSLHKQARDLHDALSSPVLFPLEAFVEHSARLVEAPVDLDDLRTALLYFKHAFLRAAQFYSSWPSSFGP